MDYMRSLLFVPANDVAKIGKAIASSADAVVLDLEDSVISEAKNAARDNAAAVLTQPRARPLLVRINGLATPLCWDDIRMCAGAIPDAVIVPKVEAAHDLRILDWVLTQLEVESGHEPGSIRLIATLETARGLAEAQSIAVASKRVDRLALGAVDLALDMDMDMADDMPLASARFAVTLASRLAGLHGPIDTAFVDFRDLGGLKRSSVSARNMGFHAKFCIHPSQLETVCAVFCPSAMEVARAERILAAFKDAEQSGLGAVQVDGVMIDRPVVEKARHLLAWVGAAPT